MNKEKQLSLHKTFDALSKEKLKIHYSSTNILQTYLQVAGRIRMDGYLGYAEDHRSFIEKHPGAIGNDLFHVILSVQVFNQSVFVPFFEVYSTRVDGKVVDGDVFSMKDRKEILELGINNINYNYSQFMAGFFREQINNGQDAPCCEFKVKCSDGSIRISDIRYLSQIKQIEEETPWYERNDVYFEETDIKAEALRKDLLTGSIQDPETRAMKEKHSFAEILSKFYAKKGIPELWFSFFNLDSDFDSGDCLTRVMILSTHLNEVPSFLRKQLDRIREIVSFIRSRYVSDLLLMNRYETIKTAVAAIMSRNMSHNLGSHYLFYTKDRLEKIADKSQNMGPDVRGAAKVLAYLQGRMDYLATIVANDKYPYGSVNFKSQIWDELTIDDFSRRHYNTPQKDVFNEDIEGRERALSHAGKMLDNLKAKLESYKESRTLESSMKVDSYLSELFLQCRTIGKRNWYNRTTNYLLSNLILSEGYSRPDVLYGKNESQPLFLFVSVWNEDTSCFEKFTGANDSQTLAIEDRLKSALSKINLAFPGGTMSCHAFYNILENFIRNSAKYSWTGAHPESLTFTVALKVDKKDKTVTCTIYDDKHDALKARDGKHKRSLLDDLQTRLRRHTRVLGENSTIDKGNKGLKEMLFSAIWLKANETNDSLADIITEMEESSPTRRLSLIRRHAFEFLCVDDNGLETTDPNSANLALRLTLPLFTQVESLEPAKVRSLKDLVRLHTDVIEIIGGPNPELPILHRPCSSVFSRVVYEDSKLFEDAKNHPLCALVSDSASDAEDFLLPVLKLNAAIRNNLNGFDQYRVKVGDFDEPGFSDSIPLNRQIYFYTHLSTSMTKSEFRKKKASYAYWDTISGNNFTKTLEGMFGAGLTSEGKYRSFADLYFALKIKESGLTRITIVDERLFNSIKWKLVVPSKNVKAKDVSTEDKDPKIDFRSYAAEFSMRNIRILNFFEKGIPKAKRTVKDVAGFPYLYGNQFFKTGPYADSPNATNFLSIHLGIIEKMLKSSVMESVIGPRGLNSFSQERIDKLMELFKTTFGDGTHEVHICIHSGRGNFSQELEGPLREYPFISLAALESAFNNSKYLLSQLFYNTVYIGKGELNN